VPQRNKLKNKTKMLSETKISTTRLYWSLRARDVKNVIVKYLSRLRPTYLISLLKGAIRLFVAIPLIISICAMGVTLLMTMVTERLCEYTMRLLEENKS
jgi:hypothetical protein